MPFSRYLQSSERDVHDDHDDDQDIDHHFNTPIHFQLPNLIFAPTVPPGGGAEALPAGLYPPSVSWFSSSDGCSSPFTQPDASAASSPLSFSSFSSSFSPTQFPITNYPSFHPQNHPISLPYSSSGFDLLSLISRVTNRPNPTIYLGPVDLSCAFVVTDSRRYDNPIVYASPSFLNLTGYDYREVIGRNCRFLQAPQGLIQRDQPRTHTSAQAVAHLRRSILARKECQVSMVNYRKDGSPFINMVSVIPLPGGVYNTPQEADDVVYHLGFQVDLTQQPNSILTKLKDGSYVVDYSRKSLPSPANPNPPSRDWRTSSITMRGMSNQLRHLLSDSAFISSFHLSTSTHASTAIALSTSPSEPIALDPYDGNKPLHMFLLDRSPDFLHVVSLKGAFLYVAPAVRYVLGYDPDELVGRSLSEFCHPADCVPLMRELKEASATPGPSLLTATTGAPSSPTTVPPVSAPGQAPHPNSPDSALHQPGPPPAVPRPVDLLFRIQAKGRGYVWVQCRGRLHVEPGKGRKAIILSGRLRNMPRLDWGPVARAGGPVLPSSSAVDVGVGDPQQSPLLEHRPVDREFWGLLSANATFLYVGAAVRDVLGWGAGEVIGKPLADFVTGSSPQEVHMAIDVEMAKVTARSNPAASESAGLACDVLTKERNPISVHIVLYRSSSSALASADPSTQPPIVCQIKRCEAGGAPPPTTTVAHPLTESVFEETELDRASSWQYELQQLKFKNQRLADEVAALEAAIAKRYRKKQHLTVDPAGARGALRPPVGASHQPPPPPPPSPPTSTSGLPASAHFVSHSHSHSAPGPGVLLLPSQTQPQPPAHMFQHPQPQMGHTRLQGQGGYNVNMKYIAQQQQQATDSSLHAWGGFQQDVGGFHPHAHTMPVTGKRPWDTALRDSGGGGGGGV